MELIKHFKDLNFQPGDTFVWSPGQQIIFYDEELIDTDYGQLALLHEVGHALLDHFNFSHDMELMNMEMDAWDKARELAEELGVEMDEEHVDNCIESYRLWISSRSKCPDCENTGSPTDEGYYCFLCGCKWKVPASQAKRTLRKKLK